ncbi:MBL fold metallo-hydrolase [Rhizobium sp. SEMIA 4085]|uniref:Metallo-beta-lactamase family hydrolase protein n=1 Tax=Rhizobium gallicum bv. gallicum R602sp TaxID=1041138 RepID=A0A0B4XI89_9HYPH|nr:MULTISPECIES: MBL fold metallo-hydrolase [Rhizobium]AJD46303.1 metallo-beta-lactamase family hydrolase protein [Rhizobium gallicum bv. gallicum R602sp]NNH31653.1 MBL fold metallo-hydrolase [Rhizobium sp. SEMIA 4085]
MFRRIAIALTLVVTFATSGSPMWAQSTAPTDDDLKVTLLGTGTPTFNIRRFGFANLVQAGGMNIMIDSGRGAGIRLFQAGVSPGAIEAIFLTHLHSDHITGLPDILATGYLGWKLIGGRKSGLNIYGPKGTAEMSRGLSMFFAADSAIRSADEGLKAEAMGVNAVEIEAGLVFEKNGLRVTAFPVNHGEKIKSAFGYRIDYNGHSVVFSGDTKYDEKVVANAKGADLLIHEFAASPQDMLDDPVYQKILDHHTTPREAGKVFAESAAKLVVFSHQGLLPGKNGLPSWDEVVAQVRESYTGELVIGEDLMQFQIGQGGRTILMKGAEWPR